MLTWIIIAAVIILIVIRVMYELRHLKVTEHKLSTEKLSAGTVCRLLFLSDLHLRNYGDQNEDLIDLVKAQAPDVILIGGDMTVRSAKKEDEKLYLLLQAFSQTAPVFYASGNHEIALKENIKFESDRYDVLQEKCREYGITYLADETGRFPVGKNGVSEEILISGLELEYEYYDKKIKKQLTADEIQQRLKTADTDHYEILLAHPPAFFDAYADYGADLVLSGHYHGGAVRFGKAGLVSPQVRFFPKYSAGIFKKKNTVMIVTRGVGSHSVNLRLFNYPEIILVELSGQESYTKN